MSTQKILPCDCGATNEDFVGLYKYENGWNHVECGQCHKLGPGEGRARDAVKRWNEDRRAATEAVRAANRAQVDEEGMRLQKAAAE